MSSTLTHELAEGSLADWLFSGLLARYPNVTLAYSEGQIGWIPYLLERVDDVWFQHRAQGGFRGRRLELVTEPPSTFFPGHIYGCFFRLSPRGQHVAGKQRGRHQASGRV